MRLPNEAIALVLVPVFLASSPALAQQPRIVGPDTMTQALARKAETEREQRKLVIRVLARPDVHDAAARLGLSLEQAQSAVSTLSGAELGMLAQHAGAIETEGLAGGATTVEISLTTLLLLLIIVILLAS